MTNTYSHGLEKIYSFEVLNPQTVRRIEQKKEASPLTKNEPSSAEEPSITAPQQSQNVGFQTTLLDFIPNFTEKVAPCALDESIDCLHLTPFQMKAVQARGVKTVLELIHDLPHMKTHADEIRQKITAILGNSPLEKRATLDWQQLLRKLLSHVEAKERYCFLQSFNAERLLPMKPVELHEVEKWPPDMRFKAIQKTKEALLKERDYLANKWSEVVDAFLKPWLERRLKVACQFELEERLIERASPTHTAAEELIRTLLSITEMVYGGKSLFQMHLHEIETGIYVATITEKERYLTLLKSTLSYFYDDFSSYPFDTLLRYIERDFARNWIGYPDGYVRKALLNSPSFQLFRNERGSIFIQKRYTYA